MTNIFVGSLSFKTTEEELRKEFEAFGEVSSVKIIEDRETRRSRGFAFVEMPDRQQAMAAISAMNGKELAGQILKVNEAKPKEARTFQSRERSGGGYGFSPAGSRTQDHQNTDIYDSKDRRSGAPGSRGRGGRGPGGRSGGGRRSH